MIEDIEIEWEYRIENREKLKEQGFISSIQIFGSYDRCGLDRSWTAKKLRDRFKEDRKLKAIRLCCAGVIKYWYCLKDLKKLT